MTASFLPATPSANAVIRLLTLGRTAGLQLPGHRRIEDRPAHGLFQGPQHLTSYCTHCLPACLYSLLIAMNICYRNLRGHLSMLWELTSHIRMYHVHTQRYFLNCVLICSRSWIVGGKQNSSLEKDKKNVPIEPAVSMVCR